MIKSSRTIKLCSLTFCFLTILIWLLLLLFARIHYQRGLSLYKSGEYAQALTYLSMAKGALPKHPHLQLGARDLFRINNVIGKTHYQLARQSSNIKEFNDHLKIGSSALTEAISHDPLSYRTTYWMAKTQAALQVGWQNQVNADNQNPYNALPYYKKATLLRPTGIVAHYELAKQLYKTKQTKKIPDLVKHMATIFPASVEHLTKEVYYTEEMRTEIQQGLLSALENKTTPRTTLVNLAQMSLEDKDLKAAAAYYGRAIALQPQLNTANTLTHMGMIFVKLRDFKSADEAFLKALQLDNSFEFCLQRIYKVYKKEEQFDEFIKFVTMAGKTLKISNITTFAIATCLIDTEQIEQAKTILTSSTKIASSARTYGLLAQIAEKQRDWSEMEIATQTATRLDPENADYWIQLSNALEAQKKYHLAEAAATRAIDSSKQDIFWFYGLRAGLRMKQEKFEAAIPDWEKALLINPTFAKYYFYLAKSYNALKKYQQALFAINQALTISPNNELYLSFKKTIPKSGYSSSL